MLTLSRLHRLRGERSNVPRESAALYEAEELVTTAQHRMPELVRSVTVINAIE